MSKETQRSTDKFHWDVAAADALEQARQMAPWSGTQRSPQIGSFHALSDLEGKTLGVAEGDLSIRLWPALARQNGIKTAGVKQKTMSAAVREPMLSAGQVDAVTGFSYLSAINLRVRGVPADDLAVLRFADYGCEAYGLAVIVNPAFAAKRPEAVRLTSGIGVCQPR
jgi:ABC-type nitrate/sulfonate/bicarbonate transport system substrate-binding protein